MELIETIEEIRNSRLIVCYTGDRQGQEIRIASDIHPFCFKHLQEIGNVENIDLFLYSIGGITVAGYGMVNLIREFCENFNVIIPFKAFSCATLISLGANEILMTKLGQLSPIDPSVEHPLGPQVELPGQQKVTLPVNVEDAVSFLNLAKEEANLKDANSLSKVFERLSTEVHPLTLGAVERSREQIAILAKSLLKYHINDEEQINRIVRKITRELFSHGYIIGRKEAKETLELNIIETEADSSLNEAIFQLHNYYDELLQLRVPYHPELYLGQNEIVQIRLNRGILESNNLTHVFGSNLYLRRVEVTIPPSPAPVVVYQTRSLGEAWILDNSL